MTPSRRFLALHTATESLPLADVSSLLVSCSTSARFKQHQEGGFCFLLPGHLNMRFAGLSSDAPYLQACMTCRNLQFLAPSRSFQDAVVSPHHTADLVGLLPCHLLCLLQNDKLETGSSWIETTDYCGYLA